MTSRFFADTTEQNTRTVITTSNQTGLPNAEWASVTGLSFELEPNKSYYFSFNIIVQTDATTTGVDVSCTGPAAPVVFVGVLAWWSSFTSWVNRATVSYDDANAASTSAGNVPRPCTVEGTIVTGATGGTLIARVRKETAGTAQVNAGSSGRLWILD